MRTVSRSTGHPWQEALLIGQTLTINANPDRTLLSLSQLGTKTTLTITGGNGAPMIVASTSNESIGEHTSTFRCCSDFTDNYNY